MSETALLTAVREHLVNKCGYRDVDCSVELDPMTIPAMVGDLYVVVSPGGWTQGPVNDTSGGVLDELFAIDITVIKRATAVPRDRRRQFLLDNLQGLNVQIRKIINAVQFDYDINNAANALLGDTEEGFVEPLRFASCGPTMELAAEVFGARPGEAVAGIGRTARFTKARRIQNLGPSAT